MNRPGDRRVAASPERFRPLRQLVAAGVMVCAVAVLAGAARAEGVKVSSSQRNALILYNFARFIEWPKSAFADDNAPFVIAVLGRDPSGRDIDTETIQGRIIKGHKVKVIHLYTADEVSECHLLFICSSEIQRLPRILKRLEKSSILTTAETPDFIEKEGIINLIPELQPNGTETVGFEVNLAAATKAHLKLDTQLLKLARKVKS